MNSWKTPHASLLRASFVRFLWKIYREISRVHFIFTGIRFGKIPYPAPCLFFGTEAWWRHQMETFSALLAFFAHKGQWRGALIFSLIYAWTSSWAYNGDTGDLRRHCAHYDVIVMASAMNRCPALILQANSCLVVSFLMTPYMLFPSVIVVNVSQVISWRVLWVMLYSTIHKVHICMEWQLIYNVFWTVFV